MPDDRFLVVGIGASAGGVEALQSFFAAVPPDPRMAFIVVTHLGAGTESALPQILARATPLPVVAAQDGVSVEPNRVYVLASDRVPFLRDGHLHLMPHPAAREYNVIDVFFSSLAEDRSEDAVGVILSGAGHDGTLGAKAIKERGGLTIAQLSDHSAPRYPEMPTSAIASGAVDLKVPVEEMGNKLVEYRDSVGALDGALATEPERVTDRRTAICDILHADLGHDFTGYKERTFLRRVERRMQVLGLRDLDAYVERLRKDRQEVVDLFHDLLIGVTAFFRDRDAFDALQERVVPALFDGKGPNDSVRVWVPGCATGEEAYSIAILLLAHADRIKARPKLLVFATDIDEPAIALARAARYPAAMMHNLDAERIDRYFSGDGIGYTVAKEVRDLCIFSSHSVIRDPPFSRIDLISCRNLLIYLDRELQQRVIPTFHYALRPGGYLFLGTSETLSQYPELFNPIDQKQRLFQRRDHAGLHRLLPAVIPLGRPGPSEPRAAIRSQTGLPIRHLVESRVIDQFAPAHVVATRDGDIVHFSPRTGKYLENASGAPSRNVIVMARRGLRLDLRSALGEAAESRQPAHRAGVRVEFEDRIQVVDIIIEPMPDHADEPLFLILFCDVGTPLSPDRLLPVAQENVSTVATEHLEREMRELRERLQSVVEEYETALEELKSANEEMVSVNEELQSTNEELETSREEAQSVNEELSTVNSELERKVQELGEATSHLQNMFDGTEIPTVFLDRDLVIRTFTPAIRGIFNLIEIDRGRPLTDIANEMADFDLRSEVNAVLATGQRRERRIRRRDGTAHYLMRVLPYRTHTKATDGVLVTFSDITRIAEAEERQRELRLRIDSALQLVLAIAGRTLPENEWSAALASRLRALADISRLISAAPADAVPLAELAARELAVYGIGHKGRVAIDGAPLLLRGNAAIALGMALHELSVNASAGGALSVPQGRVHLAWAIERPDGADARLVIRWRESGGPSPPGGRDNAGFGKELIERTLAEQLGGSAVIALGKGGLRAEIALPLSTGLVLLPGSENK